MYNCFQILEELLIRAEFIHKYTPNQVQISTK